MHQEQAGKHLWLTRLFLLPLFAAVRSHEKKQHGKVISSVNFFQNVSRETFANFLIRCDFQKKIIHLISYRRL